MLHRFSRTELLVGQAGLDKLSNCTVAVFGVGGVGSFACEALARMGVGHLVLVDYDDVCLTNINRQLIALQNTVGRPKVEVMTARIHEINPKCRITEFGEFYKPERAERLLSNEYDYVVDAIDTVTAKVDLLERCWRRQIPVISAMGAGNKIDPTKIDVVDISQTHTCPLARVVRTELRKRGIERGIKAVFSIEQPLEIQQSVGDCRGGCICPNKEELEFVCTMRRTIPGSTPFVPPAFGLAAASVVVRDILGI